MTVSDSYPFFCIVVTLENSGGVKWKVAKKYSLAAYRPHCNGDK